MPTLSPSLVCRFGAAFVCRDRGFFGALLGVSPNFMVSIGRPDLLRHHKPEVEVMLATLDRIGPEISERNRLVIENGGLVGYVVSRLAARDSTDPEELHSWGVEGLIQAAGAYDASRGLSFATYAIHRIRGRILDALRRADPLPRPLRGLVKRAGRARVDLTHALGREPSRQELADELDVSLQMLARVEAAARSSVLSIDKIGEYNDGTDTVVAIEVDESSDPQAEAERKDLARRLRTAISGLSERQKFVLQRCYVDEEPLASIGDALGISPSRVSQIHREAVDLLRSRLALEQTPEAA
jgi:RNA polymerase sigma factor FliA